MKRDFASLTPQEALHVAIFIEERNAEIYHQFAELFAEFRDPESRVFCSPFWGLSHQARQHGPMLQKRYIDRDRTRPYRCRVRPLRRSITAAVHSGR